MLEERLISCPYCGEPINIMLDSSVGSEHYIEDCQVCCRPMEVIVHEELNGDRVLSIQRDDD